MLLATLLFFQHVVLQDLPAVERNPFTTAADLEQGKKLYRGRCAGCHGPEGDGGKGANLVTPTLSCGETDIALYRTIRYGLPDTEMPSHNMTQREIWQMAAYVRSLGQTNAVSAHGDSAKGETLVRGKGGCLQCHLMDGEGGSLGPSLTDIGRRRSQGYLRTKLLTPGDDVAVGEFRMVKLTTRDGQKITGVRINEDTWSIQVRDTNARLHSFWKEDLTELNVERKTVMPSYGGRFNEQELNDVLVFLGGKR
jgi:cytochrome c oxidase cbb3-type subunit 3